MKCSISSILAAQLIAFTVLLVASGSSAFSQPIAVNPSAIDIAGNPGDSLTVELEITNLAGDLTLFSIESDAPWLVIKPYDKRLYGEVTATVELFIESVPDFVDSLSTLVTVRSYDPVPIEVPFTIWTPVEVPDINLRTGLAWALGLESSDPLIPPALASLASPVLTNGMIVDLTGISYCTGVTVLDLSHNDISDLSALSTMTQLGELILRDNQVSDLSPLVALPNLTKIDLSENQISNLLIPDGLTALRSLYLEDNQIIDLSALSGLTSLYYLFLSGNDISDLSPLSNLTDLILLELNHNQVNEISPLASLIKLSTIELRNNQISDLSPLSGLTKLHFLYLSDNQITDISPLSGFTELLVVDLSSNRIVDVSVLLELSNITSLHIENNFLDFSVGSAARELTYAVQDRGGTVSNYPQNAMISATPVGLELAGEDGGSLSFELLIANVGPVELEYSVSSDQTWLDVDGTQTALPPDSTNSVTVSSSELPAFLETLTATVNVSSTDPNASSIDIPVTIRHPVHVPDDNLRAVFEQALGLQSGEPVYAPALAGLESLNLRSKSIQDLTGLSECTGLRVLLLEWNPISDISELTGLASLEVLALENNLISDVSPIRGLTNLKTLILGSNPIEDISPLSGLVGLQYLYLSRNEISDISGLSELVNLTTLNLSENNLMDISALSGLVNLSSLIVYSNYLDIRDGSDARAITDAIIDNGGSVSYDPQKTMISVNRDSLDLPGGEGETLSAELQLINSGPIDVEYTVTSNQAWLSVGTYTTPLIPEASVSVSLSTTELPAFTDALEAIVTIASTDPNAPLIEVPVAISALVTIPDPNLKAALQSVLGLQPADPILLHLLSKLESLELKNAKIQNLSGLSYCTNLFNLDLSTNLINDLSPLSELTGLTSLNLEGNSISDLVPLSGLTALDNLNLSSNQITDVTDLVSIAGLRYLYLENNHISDISPLIALNHLLSLRLATNPINDFSPLSSLTGLTGLSLGHSLMKDLPSLNGMPSLQSMYLYNTQVSDLSPLSSLSDLQVLLLDNNQIYEISPLTDLPLLFALSIRSNYLDLSAGSDDRAIIDAISAYATVYFDPQKASMQTLDQWALTMGLPSEASGDSDIIGALGIKNILAYAMGIDPLTATPDLLPQTQYDEAGETIAFTFKRDLNVIGIHLDIQTSTDLLEWLPGEPVQFQVIADDGAGHQTVEAVFPKPADGLFIRLSAERF